MSKDTVKGFLQIFETQFPLSKQAREKGRVQSVIKVESTNKIKELMLEFVSSKSRCFQSTSGPDDSAKNPNSDLGCLHTYGFTSSMRFSGTEFMGMAAVRFGVRGDREVVAVNAADLWPIVLEHHAEEAAKLSAEKNVASFLGEKLMYGSCECAWVQALLKEKSAIIWEGRRSGGLLVLRARRSYLIGTEHQQPHRHGPPHGVGRHVKQLLEEPRGPACGAHGVCRWQRQAGTPLARRADPC